MVRRLLLGFLVRRFKPVQRVVGDPGEPAFEANWSSGTSLRFYRTAEDIVHIEGSAVNSVDSSPSAIFTLPAGYRPGGLIQWRTSTGGLGEATIQVDAAGVVTMASGDPSQTVHSAFSFLAEG